MDSGVFDQCITRLAATYGERAYPAERKASLWRALKDRRNEELLAAVEQLISNERHAPMLPDILVALSRAPRPPRPDEVLMIPPPSACSYCSGLGTILAMGPNDLLATTAFRCFCSAGNRNSSRYAQWSVTYEKAGFTLVRPGYAAMTALPPIKTLANETTKEMPGVS